MANLVLSFAELGRTFRAASAPVEFAAQAMANAGVLQQVQAILEEEVGDLDGLSNVTFDPDTDTFRGRARQRISVARSQTYEFTIDPDQMSYRLVDADQAAQFAEEYWLEVAEFVATKGKSGKKLNCKPGNVQCGGKCQSGSRNCFHGMSPAQKKAAQKAAKAAKAAGGAPDAGGAIVPAKGALAKTPKAADGAPPRETQQDKINEKYASAKPTEKDIDGWQNDMLKYHTSPEGLALFEMTSKYHVEPGNRLGADQEDYIKAIADRRSFIDATVRKQNERIARQGASMGQWESYSVYTAAERQKMEKTIANPRTSDKTRQKLQKNLDKDKASSEAAAQATVARFNRPESERRKELEDEFDQAEKDAAAQSKKLQDSIAQGDTATIERELERRVLRPLGTYRDANDDPSPTRRREIIREHLVDRHMNSRPERVLNIGANPTVDEVKRAYRDAARKAHPDTGGSADEFQRVNNAFNRLRQTMGFSEFMEPLDLAEFAEFLELMALTE